MLAALYTPDEAFDAHAYEDRLTNDGGLPGLGPSVRLVFSLLLSLRSGQCVSRVSSSGASESARAAQRADEWSNEWRRVERLSLANKNV